MVALWPVYFVRKWPHIVLGVALIGSGTALTIWAQGRASEAQLQNKIDGVIAKIEAARSHESNEGTSKQLTTIRDDFVAWAKQFEQDRERRQLKRSQTLLEQETARLQATLPAREFFVTASDILRGSLLAYASQTGRPIKVNVPAIPNDIQKEKWEGGVEFTPEISWKLEIHPNYQGDQQYSLYIFPLYPGATSDTRFDQAFSLAVELSDPPGAQEPAVPRWSSFASGRYFVPADGLNSRGPLDKYEAPVKAVLQNLIELQIIIAADRRH